jgi:squalene-associated FAD-dependent desaturase
VTATGSRAVVVGGGLAGTSAAVALADGGWEVTLLEARPRLGGAVYSFERSGRTVDTGQHVLLRCYTAYRALLSRLGVEEQVPVQRRMDIPVLRPGRPMLRLRRTPLLPAPAHLLPALARYSALTAAERIGAARAMARLRALDRTDPRHDAVPFGDWLRDQGQSERALSALWGLVAVAALNIDVDQASLAAAAQVLQVGLLEQARAGDIAMPEVPLSAIHDRAAGALLDRLGVRRRVGAKVQEVARLGGDLLVRTADGELEADRVVLAVPHREAAALAPADACPDRAAWAALGASPIVNVHLRYDRPVTGLRFAAALDSVVPWFFSHTPTDGHPGQDLVVSVSAADVEVRRRSQELVTAHTDGLAALLPAARRDGVVDAFVTREPRATFAQRAGTGPLRPAPGTRWPGLVLAGAWTRTGWPDTMEGAVRSGLTAAGLLGVPGRTFDEQTAGTR